MNENIYKKIQKIYKDNTIGALPSLRISNKQKDKISLIPNIPQKKFIKIYLRNLRIIILKARQMGLSTIIQALFFLDTILNEGVNTVIVSHERDSTQRMLARMNNFYEWMKISFPQIIPEIGKHGRQSVNEIYFPKLNSRIFIGTAGADAFGRGDTINNLHLSEVSSYKGRNVEELIKGLVGAVPVKTGRIIMESTARGIGNLFHESWIEDSNYYKLFLPWFIHKEYELTKDELKNLIGNKIEFPTVNNLEQEEIELIEQVEREYKKTLSFEQLAFRRYQRKEYGKLYYQEFAEDPVTAFLVAQSDIFDSNKVRELLRTCNFNTVDEYYDGRLLIWKMPEEGRTYDIGADTSEGNIRSDYCCASVIDVESGEQMAELHGRWKPYVFANKLADLGELYWNAQIAVERNNHGHAVLLALDQKNNYPNIYEHEDEKMGWPTNAKTKPIMITGSGGLEEAVSNEYLKIHSRGFLRECLTFEYKESKASGNKGYYGMGATKGSYDDIIMANAITWITRTACMIVKNKDKAMVA